MSHSSRISFVPCAACGNRTSILDFDPAKPYRCSTCGAVLTPPPTGKTASVDLPSSVHLDPPAEEKPFWSVGGGAPPPPTPSPSTDSDTLRLAPFGKYTLVREIGRGGMGFVYEAVDTQLDRRVALKMLYTSPNADPKEAALDEERFLREAKLCASLPKHPGIVSVYESGIIDGRRYLAMEFIDGRSMSAWRRMGSVTLRAQVALLRDVAQAVHHAHEHGVIHRDLKPQNVLVDARNRPNVTDFGLAKSVGQDVALSLTASGMVVGTPSYMSPEQAQGLATIDRRSDVYSLGVMLYEILTGRLPFTGHSPVDILMKVLRDPLVPPSTAAKTRRAASPGRPPPDRVPSGLVHAVIDPGIEAVCLKALARNPDQRYPSAQAFAEDLSAWLKGEPVKAVPPPAPSPPDGETRSPRPLAVATTVLGVVAVTLAIVLTTGSPPEPKPDPIPAAPPPEPAVASDPASPPPEPVTAPWWPRLQELQHALEPDDFEPATAGPLLARVREEFPDHAGEIDALVEKEHRTVTRFLDGLGRDRWLAEQPRVRRYRAWLLHMKKPVDIADPILRYRGVCTVTLHVHPYAEVRGPLVKELAPEDRFTPLTLGDVAIADGRIELVHPAHGTRLLTLDGLEDGKAYVVDGDWTKPDGIALRGEP
jgi:serine/threonine protein kinase/ribosomal protein S27E